MNHSDDKGWSYPFETLPEWQKKEIFHLWEHPGSDTACVIYHETELRGMSDWTGAIALLKNKAKPKLLFAEIGYDTPDWGPAYSENGQFLFMKTHFNRDGRKTTAFLILDMLQEPGFNHQVETETGLCGQECSQMIKGFFKALRLDKSRGAGYTMSDDIQSTT